MAVWKKRQKYAKNVVDKNYQQSKGSPIDEKHTQGGIHCNHIQIFLMEGGRGIKVLFCEKTIDKLRTRISIGSFLDQYQEGDVRNQL